MKNLLLFTVLLAACGQEDDSFAPVSATGVNRDMVSRPDWLMSDQQVPHRADAAGTISDLGDHDFASPPEDLRVIPDMTILPDMAALVYQPGAPILGSLTFQGFWSPNKIQGQGLADAEPFIAVSFSKMLSNGESYILACLPAFW